ncbi:MAG: glycosyltransferase family 39 protein [Acidobacteriota bacterium]|nr:glycosyltransferase family 39 protein [Acidobacteriota bacterium]
MRTGNGSGFGGEGARRALLVAVLAAYLLLSAGSALTERPGVDEGFFANPAVNLLRRGFMGTTTIETAGTTVESMKRHTYWVMPLHLVVQAGWYRLFGFSLFSMRSISILFGLVALLAWFKIIKSLSDDPWLALLACALVGCDLLFVSIASSGRMDMMSASLGFSSYAVYLLLRRRDLTRAVLASQSLAVASGLTHPVGGTLAFSGLLFLTLYSDRARLTWKHLAVALVPYAVGALGWGLYIAQEPASFVRQFRNNATMNNRMGGFSNPLRALLDEFAVRHATAFGLGSHSPGHGGAIYLKALVLAAYAAAVVGVIVVRDLRRHRGFRALLLLTLIYFLVLALLDGQKMTYNLVYIVPLYAALLAVFLRWLWTTRNAAARALAALCLCGVLLLQIGGALYKMRQDTYRKGYVPAINFLKQNATPQSLIMGSSALGFGLDYPDNLVDDVKFGYYSGRRADFIVVDPDYAATLPAFKERQPEVAAYLDKLFGEDYRLAYDDGSYKIYVRR